MTTRREVPFTGDTLAWVHDEIGRIKSQLAMALQAADQSRGVAADALDQAHAARSKADSFDGQDASILHLQDELHVLRDHMARAQEDINSLRQSRDEVERHATADAERARQDRNEIGRRFGETERQIAAWHERVASVEEHSRRNLETAAQLSQHLEALEAEGSESGTLLSRSQTMLSRMDQEMQRVAGALGELQRQDDEHRERASSAAEMLRRLDTEVEALKQQTNRISRIDDRLELVQAERTRHNEQLNEIAGQLQDVDHRLNEHGERYALLEIRTSGYQEELRQLKERLQRDREVLTAFLHTQSELEGDMRKRRIIALEKEIRDIRGRALNLDQED